MRSRSITKKGGGLLLSALLAAGVGCSDPGTFVRTFALGSCEGVKPQAMILLSEQSLAGSEELRDAMSTYASSVVREAAEACGSAEVATFGRSSTDVRTIATVVPHGSNDEDRAARLEEDVAALASAVTSVDAQNVGSDPIGALLSSAPTAQAWDHGRPRAVVLVGDAISTVDPVDLATDELTAGTAASFVSVLDDIPDLKGVDLTIVGVGRVAGDPPPTAFAQGLIAFWSEACERMRASSCTVADSYVAARVTGGAA